MQKSFFKYFSRPSVLALIGIATILSACAKEIQTHGQVMSEQRIDALRVGVDTKDTVQRLLGSPSTTGTFEEDRWYYIMSITEREPLESKELVERDILILDFDDENRLTSVYRKSKADGNVIQPIGKTTPTYGQSLGIVDQLLQNLGRGL